MRFLPVIVALAVLGVGVAVARYPPGDGWWPLSWGGGGGGLRHRLMC